MSKRPERTLRRRTKRSWVRTPSDRGLRWLLAYVHRAGNVSGAARHDPAAKGHLHRNELPRGVDLTSGTEPRNATRKFPTWAAPKPGGRSTPPPSRCYPKPRRSTNKLDGGSRDCLLHSALTPGLGGSRHEWKCGTGQHRARRRQSEFGAPAVRRFAGRFLEFKRSRIVRRTGLRGRQTPVGSRLGNSQHLCSPDPSSRLEIAGRFLRQNCNPDSAKPVKIARKTCPAGG